MLAECTLILHFPALSAIYGEKFEALKTPAHCLTSVREHLRAVKLATISIDTNATTLVSGCSHVLVVSRTLSPLLEESLGNGVPTVSVQSPGNVLPVGQITVLEVVTFKHILAMRSSLSSHLIIPCQLGETSAGTICVDLAEVILCTRDADLLFRGVVWRHHWRRTGGLRLGLSHGCGGLRGCRCFRGGGGCGCRGHRDRCHFFRRQSWLRFTGCLGICGASRGSATAAHGVRLEVCIGVDDITRHGSTRERIGGSKEQGCKQKLEKTHCARRRKGVQEAAVG